MAERIRHASVYIEGKLEATMTTGEFTHNSGDESQVADGGYIGHSDGADTSTLSTDHIVPVAGRINPKIEDALEKKKYLQISVALLNGKVHSVEMRCTSKTYSWDSTKGMLTGKFSFEGGKPERIG